MQTAEEKRFWYTLIIMGGITVCVFVLLIVKLVQKNQPTFQETKNDPASLLPTIRKTDPMRGSLSPKLIVTVYSNFTCRNCAETARILNQKYEQYPNDLLIIWKDFPAPSLHAESERASIAARCAGEQKQFWPYHDYLMNYQRELSPELYLAIAEDLQLKTGKFQRCVRKQKTEHLVRESYEEAINLELAGAPTIFLNTERITGKITEHDIDWRMNMLLNQNP